MEKLKEKVDIIVRSELSKIDYTLEHLEILNLPHFLGIKFTYQTDKHEYKEEKIGFRYEEDEINIKTLNNFERLMSSIVSGYVFNQW